MWLRDFLPQAKSLYPRLSRLRVMTLGYSSLVRDSRNITGLDEWTMGLIQSVSSVRTSRSVRLSRLTLLHLKTLPAAMTLKKNKKI